MFVDLDQPVCSVTRELVQEVADSNPNVFKTPNGSINEVAVLYYLGFHVDASSKYNYQGVYILDEVYVRDYKNPERCYRTTVYNGRLRKAHKTDAKGKVLFNEKGKPLYSKAWHELYDVYINVEVLQPSDLKAFVSEDRFENILDVGNDWDTMQKKRETLIKEAVTNVLTKEERIKQKEDRYSWAKDYHPENGDIRQYDAANKLFSDKDQGEGYISDLEDIHANVK
ncbi:coil containing protein [Vibrio phage 1.101.O._10N.261.45.C6]|nr:coil containing protein [Vibrio phage 1.101.O._10N.261.45.C6]